jgi:two-component system response regulator MprA
MGYDWNDHAPTPVRSFMTAPRLFSTGAAIAVWPVHALAASGGLEAVGGEVPATALLGVVAAYAWHKLSRSRAGTASRWQYMNLGDRLPILRLGERLHALHLREALSAALHLGGHPRERAAPAHLRRVLIVDDDADVRSAIGEALVSGGFAVAEAQDGVEALTRARDSRPDLILLDLGMPRMDGFAFRAAQRADAALASIPVVVVSASEPDKARDLGAAAYLHKPFDLSVLLDAVGRCAVPA